MNTAMMTTETINGNNNKRGESPHLNIKQNSHRQMNTQTPMIPTEKDIFDNNESYAMGMFNERLTNVRRALRLIQKSLKEDDYISIKDKIDLESTVLGVAGCIDAYNAKKMEKDPRYQNK